jgi:hypothetical protein
VAARSDGEVLDAIETMAKRANADRILEIRRREREQKKLAG